MAAGHEAARVASLVGFSIFLAPLWPLLKIATLASAAPGIGTKVPQRARNVLRPLAWPLVGLMAFGAALNTLLPDLARSVRVWRRILPIFSAYMWTKHATDLSRRLFRIGDAKVEARWAARHEWGGERVYRMVSQVRGYYVKSGQVLATKPDIIPKAWCTRLARLWDDTTPRPWSDVRGSIEADLANTGLAARLAGKDREGAAKPVPHKPHTKTPAPSTNAPGAAATPGARLKAPALPALGSAKDGAQWSTASNASDAQASTTTSWAASKLGSIAAWVGLGANNATYSDTHSTGTAGGAGAPLPHGGFSAWLKSPGKGVPGFAGVEEGDEEGEGGGDGARIHAARRKSKTAAAPAGPLVPSLFTVSATATAVLTERAQERPPPPHRRRLFGLPFGGRGSREEGARKAQSHAKPGSYLARWFEWVDQTPLASASIAQVHAARLSPELLELLGDSWQQGDDVVIKVQHRDVQKLMGADLRNMGRIATFLKAHLPFDVMPAVREMRAVIPKEFDFEREARLMQALRVRLARSAPKLVVPEPVMPLCGPGCIVMQRLYGTPLTALLSKAAEGDESARMAARRTLLPVLEAYGQMMLVGGLFHADPHPGNMLLLPDGRVGLLDFGQCKALGVDERRALCVLYLALAKGDAKMALAAAAPCGVLFGDAATAATDGAKPGAVQGIGQGSGSGAGGNVKVKVQGAGQAVDAAACLKMMTIMFDTRYLPEGDGYGFGGGDVVEGAPLSSFPGPLYLVCRAILIMRGLVSALKLENVSVVSMWKSAAQAGLREATAVATARAAENAALDRGLIIKGLEVA